MSTSPNFGDACSRGVAAGEHVGRQRLDVGLDLDVGAKFVAHRLFEAARDIVRGGERQRSSTSRSSDTDKPSGNRLHGDVVDGEAAIARDHHDALAHRFVIERARLGGDRDFGLRHRGADGARRVAP